ncbi:diguanylate cyclase (GGDEF) domain-containing protein [Rivularia sp. PCC 7116]|uniref:GGDEF domain-containing protein n=1 Tax=Rivularia sp. PCC 7116 TaxID=373994 RepID=UPI00029ECCB5|nr:GGDEF domain-containing protein [Rivularia sp. PCC 7116]AFY57131.1 diguanylate cyclase (GGDEF) domain-containing protein [Rivularia sp. PCC 7116]
MNISILVFGNEEFLATLPTQVKDTDAFSLEAINNLGMAVSRIQQEPPDIILVQSSQNESMQLCSWLKEQTKLSWIYCILLEDSLELIAERSHQSWEWELEMTSKALRLGADAYIWYGNAQDSESIRQRRTDSFEAHLNPSHRLLLSQLNVALRKAHKYRDLMQTNDLLSTIALADSLTELNNRRALQWDLPRQIQKAREDDSPLSLIILDVDYFKKVNDNYGHLVGDRLLKLLSSRIRHNLRIQDTAFRYGGEEFVVILSDTTLEEADLVARRLNSIIRENPFFIDSTLNINVTISLGTSCLLTDDDDQGLSLLNRADSFLLQAKSKGRDRVVSCGKNIADSQTAALSQKNCLNEVNYGNFSSSSKSQSFPIKIAG